MFDVDIPNSTTRGDGKDPTSRHSQNTLPHKPPPTASVSGGESYIDMISKRRNHADDEV